MLTRFQTTMATEVLRKLGCNIQSQTHAAPVELFRDCHGRDRSRGTFNEWKVTHRARSVGGRVDYTLRHKDGACIRSKEALFAYFENKFASSVASKKRKQVPAAGGATKKKKKEKKKKKVDPPVSGGALKMGAVSGGPKNKPNKKVTLNIWVEQQGFKISNRTKIERVKKHFLKLPRYEGYTGVDLYDANDKLVESLDKVGDGQKLTARVFIRLD